LSTFSIRVLRAVFASVEARYDGIVWWRGGQVDRLLDERHAELVGKVAGMLRTTGWDVHLEVTFSVYGDRGSIDILAVRRDERLALVVEVKSEITAIGETIRRLDIKDRMAAGIVRDRLEWRPLVVSRLLVVAANATARRRVARHEGSLGPAFPARGPQVRRWLGHPSGRMSGLLFVGMRSPASGSRSNISRRNVRTAGKA
jgi:hypothetical protein